jgi:endoglucanase
MRAQLVLVPALLLAACAADPNYEDPLTPIDPGPVDWPRGLHVVGNQIHDHAGNPVVLHGINRSGSEYACVSNAGFFDGPSNDSSVSAIKSWRNVNAVRIPLNESCWLGINGVSERFSGESYKLAIKAYVALLHKHDLIPILELHWVGPGTMLADDLLPLPDADHALVFWADVAATFRDDDAVVFEAFNEPYPDRNRDSDAGWLCWRDGCVANLRVPAGEAASTYQGVGMQSIVTAIRDAGSSHVILLGGLQYSNALSQWLTYKPTDPLNNLGAAWHVYNFNACVADTCWNAAPAGVAAMVPLVVTEFGQNDCSGGFVTSLMTWLDGKSSGYLAWSWNAYGACQAATPPDPNSGKPWSLITGHFTGTPNGGYAQAVHDHIANLQ